MPAKSKAKKQLKRGKAEPQTITFNYIKGTQHRVIHIDGAMGSLTPQGFVVANLYSERFPIPKETTHTVIDGKGVSGVPDMIEGKKGIVREIDVTAVLTPESAKRLGEWLIAKANEFESRFQRAEALQKGKVKKQ